jgi:hypothetical protein
MMKCSRPAVLATLLVASTITFFACNPPGEQPGSPGGGGEEGGEDSKVILAFSGGGYHALSGGAGWLMGMMERTEEYSLAEVTSNVSAIGSNSGGSWLMTLSSYSKTFLDEIQEPGAYEQFTTSEGYMGKVWSYIQQPTGGCQAMPKGKSLCEIFYGIVKAEAGSGFANFLVSGSGQWQTVVENSVFGKGNDWGYYSDVENSNLSTQRNDWINDKDLVLAGTFLTQEPALTYTSTLLESFVDVQTLQASQALSSQLTGGVPILLKASGGPYVDALPGGTLDLTYGTWKWHDFSWRFMPGTASSDSTTLTNAELSDVLPTLPVINAAAISSAAGGGFIDIPILGGQGKGLVDGKDTATALNGFAPAYQMYDPTSEQPVMAFQSSVHNTFVGDSDSATATTALATNKVVRLADGGFVDNTAVAQMLRYLQDANNGKIPSGFTLVAFDDLPAPQTYWDPKTPSEPLPTGGDIAALFGFGGCTKDSCSMQQGNLQQPKLMGLQYSGMSARMFSCGQYFNEEEECAGGPPLDRVYWQAQGDERILCDMAGTEVEQPLLYSRYEVSIDASAPGTLLYGIQSQNDGVSGTLHVFSMLGGSAAVVPGSQDAFNCYGTMITGMVENLKKTGGSQCDPSEPESSSNPCTLGDYLENALGI